MKYFSFRPFILVSHDVDMLLCRKRHEAHYGFFFFFFCYLNKSDVGEKVKLNTETAKKNPVQVQVQSIRFCCLKSIFMSAVIMVIENQNRNLSILCCVMFHIYDIFFIFFLYL